MVIIVDGFPSCDWSLGRLVGLVSDYCVGIYSNYGVFVGSLARRFVGEEV